MAHLLDGEHAGIIFVEDRECLTDDLFAVVLVQHLGHARDEVVHVDRPCVVGVVLLQEILHLLLRDQRSHCPHGQAHVVASHGAITLAVEENEGLPELLDLDIREAVLKLVHISCILLVSSYLYQSEYEIKNNASNNI